MRSQENGGAGFGPVQTRKDIFCASAGSVIVTCETGLHLRLIAKRGKFGEDAVADDIVCSASGGMRNAIANQAAKHGTRTTGGKLTGGNSGFFWVRREAGGHPAGKKLKPGYR